MPNGQYGPGDLERADLLAMIGQLSAGGASNGWSSEDLDILYPYERHYITVVPVGPD